MLNHFVIRRLIETHNSIDRRRPWQSQSLPLPIRSVQDRTRWYQMRANWPSLPPIEGQGPRAIHILRRSISRALTVSLNYCLNQPAVNCFGLVSSGE